MMSVTLFAAALVGGGLFLAVVSWRRKEQRYVRNLREVLELQYLEQGATDLSPAEASKLLARSGAVAEKALGNTTIIARLRSKIERSDWTIAPGEFVAISLGYALAGGVLGYFSGSAVLGGMLAVAGLFGPIFLVNRSVEKRRRRFEDEFPDVLDLMGASLESGAGVPQALELVVAEADEPAAGEFGKVLSATRLGSSLVDALNAMRARIGSRDLDWTVQAIVVQQRTGGRLADVLRTVAGFMRAREEVRRELKALTAEGKLSAYILGALPLGIAAVITFVNPDYLTPLFTTLPGLLMVAVAGGLMITGFVIMSRIVKIEV